MPTLCLKLCLWHRDPLATGLRLHLDSCEFRATTTTTRQLLARESCRKKQKELSTTPNQLSEKKTTLPSSLWHATLSINSSLWLWDSLSQKALLDAVNHSHPGDWSAKTLRILNESELTMVNWQLAQMTNHMPATNSKWQIKKVNTGSNKNKSRASN